MSTSLTIDTAEMLADDVDGVLEVGTQIYAADYLHRLLSTLLTIYTAESLHG